MPTTIRTRLCIVAGVPQFAHPGVHQRDAGATLLPGAQRGRMQAAATGRSRTRDGCSPSPARGAGTACDRRTRASPARRGRWRRPPPFAAVARCCGRVPDLVRAELAPAQVRREPRGGVDARACRGPAGTSPRSSARNRVERVVRAASPGVQVSRRPPAQSGCVGSRPRSSSVDGDPAAVGTVRRPQRARARPAACAARERRGRRARTACRPRTAFPEPVRMVHGSKSRRRRSSTPRGRALARARLHGFVDACVRPRRSDGSRRRRRRRSRAGGAPITASLGPRRMRQTGAQRARGRAPATAGCGGATSGAAPPGARTPGDSSSQHVDAEHRPSRCRGRRAAPGCPRCGGRHGTRRRRDGPALGRRSRSGESEVERVAGLEREELAAVLLGRPLHASVRHVLARRARAPSRGWGSCASASRRARSRSSPRSSSTVLRRGRRARRPRPPPGREGVARVVQLVVDQDAQVVDHGDARVDDGVLAAEEAERERARPRPCRRRAPP